MADYMVSYRLESEKEETMVVAVTSDEIVVFVRITGLDLIAALQALTLREVQTAYPGMSIEILDRRIVKE